MSYFRFNFYCLWRNPYCVQRIYRKNWIQNAEHIVEQELKKNEQEISTIMSAYGLTFADIFFDVQRYIILEDIETQRINAANFSWQKK